MGLRAVLMAGRYFLDGIFIGLLFGIPVGAVGAVTVQRTLLYGWRAGFVSGIGSSAADMVYAVIGVFGLTVVSDFLIRYQTVIAIAGGVLILFMGIRIASAGGGAAREVNGVSGFFKFFGSSFLIAITNPAAVLSFLFAFSLFGITGRLNVPCGMGLVGGVFTGTCIWWLVLAVSMTIHNRRQGKLPFALSWWAFVFPIGACSVLAYCVSELLALEVLPLVASGLTLLALFVWSATALGTVRGIRTGAIFAPAH